jgi:hypothetical protein
MRFSEYFSITRTDSDDWFDIDLSVDSPYLCDPYAIISNKDERLDDPRSRLISFLLELNNADEGYLESGGPPGTILRAMLAQTEPREYRLGTSYQPSGLGVSRDTFRGLKLAHMEFSVGLTDQDKAVAILRQLGAFDRISDIAANVIKADMVRYTQSITARHGLPTRPVSISNLFWNPDVGIWESGVSDLTVDGTGYPIILIPEVFLASVRRTPTESFTELQFVDFLYLLLVKSGLGSVGREVRLGETAIVDLTVLTGSDIFLIEGVKATPQTVARVAGTADRLRRFEDLAASGLHHGRNPRLVLAVPGTFASGTLRFLHDHGIAVWDASWIARQAAAVGLGTEAARFIGTEIKAESTSEPITLADRLSAVPPGKTDWPRYQRLCQEIFAYLFCPPLRPPLPERSDASRVNRRDFILPNYATGGPWEFLRQQYKADFVIFDPKNYTAKVGKSEVLQIANYLKSHGAGSFAIIVCRIGANSSAWHTIREQWTQNRKMIIVLQDEDVLQMLTNKAFGGDPVEMIMQKIEDFRLSM